MLWKSADAAGQQNPHAHVGKRNRRAKGRFAARVKGKPIPTPPTAAAAAASRKRKREAAAFAGRDDEVTRMYIREERLGYTNVTAWWSNGDNGPLIYITQEGRYKDKDVKATCYITLHCVYCLIVYCVLLFSFIWLHLHLCLFIWASYPLFSYFLYMLINFISISTSHANLCSTFASHASLLPAIQLARHASNQPASQTAS